MFPRMPEKKIFRKTYIRAWRKHRGLTLEQLAERIGDMVASNLSMLERGQRGYTQNTLESIAEALNTTVAALLTRKPSDEEDIWPIWEAATLVQRQQISEIAKTITRTNSRG